MIIINFLKQIKSLPAKPGAQILCESDIKAKTHYMMGMDHDNGYFQVINDHRRFLDL
jgi:hypothetical protein